MGPTPCSGFLNWQYGFGVALGSKVQDRSSTQRSRNVEFDADCAIAGDKNINEVSAGLCGWSANEATSAEVDVDVDVGWGMALWLAPLTIRQ